MKEVYDIDALSQVCGYFTDNTEICGGYGCSHPDNDDSEMIRSFDFTIIGNRWDNPELLEDGK